MNEKLDFVRLAHDRSVSFSTLCARFNISRPTGYKWLSRYKASGMDGLLELSRRPNKTPSSTDSYWVEKILFLKSQEPSWGAKKLYHLLIREHDKDVEDIPSIRTINRILKRHGLTKNELSKRVKKVTAFEYPEPNMLWQMDFKGHFPLLDRTRCHALTITDDHSRFNLLLAACTNEKRTTVQHHLTKVFEQYGLPDAILCDNGSPWGSPTVVRKRRVRTITTLESWLIRLGVKMIHGRPRHPQTQGKEERFHRTLKDELLAFNQFYSIKHCQKEFDKWRYKYNHVRPHESLDFDVPANRYQTSQISMPQVLPEPNYESTMFTRTVGAKGAICFRNNEIYIGEGIRGQKVAIRITEKNDVFEIYYCNQLVRKVSLKL